MKEKRALILSGGGALGAIQAGYSIALAAEVLKTKAPPTGFYGISVGAINGLGLAQHGDFSEGAVWLGNFWARLRRENVWRHWWFGYFSTFLKTGVWDTRPLRNLLTKHYNPKALKETGNRVHFGATNMVSQQYEFGTERSEDLLDWVMASAAHPGVFPFVQIKGIPYSDGGIKMALPIKNALLDGYEHLDVFLTGAIHDRKFSTELQNTPQGLLRTLDIIFDGLTLRDLAKAVKARSCRVWAPEKQLPYESLAFRKADIQAMLKQGQTTKPVELDDYLRRISVDAYASYI